MLRKSGTGRFFYLPDLQQDGVEFEGVGSMMIFGVKSHESNDIGHQMQSGNYINEIVATVDENSKSKHIYMDGCMYEEKTHAFSEYFAFSLCKFSYMLETFSLNLNEFFGRRAN